MASAACETCVGMTLTCEALGEENIRLKRTNKILRTVNGMNRRHLTRVQAGADELFLTLCESGEAELAMGELWGSGEFDCGPQDYAYMVEQSLTALCEQSERRRANPDQPAA